MKFGSVAQHVRRSARVVWTDRSDPWTDLGLTLPLFIGYHLLVVLLPYRNAADFVTQRLVRLVEQSLLAYVSVTLIIGATFYAVLLYKGERRKVRWQRYASVAAEGSVYAFLMQQVASRVVGAVHIAPPSMGVLGGITMSLGAGFYEELVFRVVLFGFGVRLWRKMAWRYLGVFTVVWALIAGLVFSTWHYVGPLSDSFSLNSMVFRWVCGVVLAAIYHLRGFAPAVWCHALYDMWAITFADH